MKYVCGDAIGWTDINGVCINGQFYPYPSQKRSDKLHTVVVNDGAVYIDGHEWKNGVWKRTLRAVLACAV